MPRMIARLPLLALALAAPLIGQSASAQTTRAEPTVTAEVAPAPEPAPIDPARLAAAKITVDHIFPAGTYAKLMGAPMDRLMDSLMGGASQMPLRELAAMGGAPAESLAKLDKASLSDIMAIYDPAYHQRMTMMIHVVMHEMGSLMGQVEPSIRDGLAEAYATKFTAEQLADMNRYFSTPTGSAYAANAMALQMDPKVMDKMQGFMPLMIKAMPDIMKKAAEATASLPKPRKWDDMTPAEHSRLAKLLGVSEEDMAAGAKAEQPAKGE